MNRSSMQKFLAASAIAVLCAWPTLASAQMGRRLPPEKKIVPDPVTGVPLTFLTTDPASDSKIYQTHQQWTSDGKWLIFRGNRPGLGSQAMAVNEQTGDIVQATQSGFSGMLCAAHKSMKLYIMRGGNAPGARGRGPATAPGEGVAARPREIVEIDLERLFADSAAGNVKPAENYERVCGIIPPALSAGGNMGLDANDDYMYFSVTGPETAELSAGQTLQQTPEGARMGAGPSGLRSMNLKTGEIKMICNVGFQIGHVQTNPVVPGEVIFCWETGGKAPQRTWFVNADGSGLRPLYPEAPYEWITHEAAFDKDEVAIAIIAHRGIKLDDPNFAGTALHPSGIAIVNLRTREMRIVGQVPLGNPGRSDWHVAGSPDGRWAAFDDFQYRLWLVDRKNGETVLLADLGHKAPVQSQNIAGAADHIHPTFSLDSTRIEVQTAMLAPDGHNLDICVVPIPKTFLERKYPEKLPE